MNCSRIRRSLPLLAGNDLSSRKARRLEKHLTKCPDCRIEVAEIRAALAAARTVAARETLDWPEAEWDALMARVRSESPERRRPPAPLPPHAWRPWAYAAAGSILVLGAVILILKIIRSQPPPAAVAEIMAATPVQPGRALTIKEAPGARYPQDLPFRIPGGQAPPARILLAAQPAPGKTAQDMMSMTLVSQKTGLQVHWTFNRNFDWEERKQ